MKDRREYNRQVKNGATRFYKDKRSAGLANAPKHLSPIERECVHCSRPFSVVPVKDASTFCSKSCQSKHIWKAIKADEGRMRVVAETISNAVKCSHRRRRPVLPMESRNCVVCNTLFKCKRYVPTKTCSRRCYRKLASCTATANPNCGGETNYKRYYYKEICFDSSWEVEVARYMDDHGIQWIRSRKIHFLWTDVDGKRRRYHPDFYLPDHNVYLDPKNKYLLGKDSFKIEAVQKENGITVVCGLKDDILSYLASF